MRSGLMMGAALLLAACGGNDTPEDGTVASGGEVLEGTVTDAMLPLVTVTSQPPLAPREAERTGPAPAATPSGNATPSSAGEPEEEVAPADTSDEATAD